VSLTYTTETLRDSLSESRIQFTETTCASLIEAGCTLLEKMRRNLTRVFGRCNQFKSNFFSFHPSWSSGFDFGPCEPTRRFASSNRYLRLHIFTNICDASTVYSDLDATTRIMKPMGYEPKSASTEMLMRKKIKTLKTSYCLHYRGRLVYCARVRDK